MVTGIGIALLLSANRNVNWYISTMYSDLGKVYSRSKEFSFKPCRTEKIYIDNILDLILQILYLLLLLAFIVEKFCAKRENQGKNQDMNKQSCFCSKQVRRDNHLLEKKVKLQIRKKIVYVEKQRVGEKVNSVVRLK